MILLHHPYTKYIINIFNSKQQLSHLQSDKFYFS